MSSGGQDGNSSFPRWNEEAATLEAFEQRVKLFVSLTKREVRYLCGPRLLSTFHPEGDAFRYVWDNLTDLQLEAADGSGAQMIVRTIRLSLLVPSQPRKVFVCCWLASDSILCDETMVKPQGSGHVDSHRNTRRLARH